MNPISEVVYANPRLVRRTARILSLILLTFYLSLIFFNEDVRENLTLPFILYGLVIISLLFAWRWERRGGLVATAGALLFGLFLLVNSLLRIEIDLLPAVLGALILFLPCFSAGWLFYTLGQRSRPIKTPGLE